MTLCIAAVARDVDHGPCIVSCFDKRGETDITSSQTEMKFRYLGGHWFALFAGDIFQANELLDLYKAHLKDKHFSKNELVDELRKPADLLREKLVDRLVRSKFSLSYREFLTLGSQFPRDIYRDTCHEISELTLDCELIIFGFVEKGAVLFVVSDDCSVGTDDWLGFAAIGSGAHLAEDWLHFREQQKLMLLQRTMYHLYEAKKFGDRAPGVGEQTELVVVSFDLLRYMPTPPLGDGLMKQLDELWVTYGPQPTLSVQPDTNLLLKGFGYPPKAPTDGKEGEG